MDKIASGSDSGSDCYVYQPIDSSDELGFRLLELAPAGDNAARVEITLFNSTLRKPVQFDALSYVWGAGGKPRVVYIEGKKLPVTANLYRALLRFRHAESARTLWIDAICIDQTNIPERNQQVQIMRTIYQDAAQVLIWLGEEESTDVFAAKLIEKFVDETSKLEQEPEQAQVLHSFVLPLAPETEPEWLGFGQLLQRPWFGRLWTLQEAYAAKKPIVLFGPHMVSWEALANLTVYIKDNNLSSFMTSSSADMMPGYVSVPLINYFRQIVVSTKRPGVALLDMLLKTLPSHATDPRDRVFALMGIAEQNHRRNVGASAISPYSSIKIDYSLSCAEVYKMVASYMLKECKELIFLGCGGLVKAGSTMDLPSWVPDWNYFDLGNSMASLVFGAHFSCGGDFEPSISVSEDNQTLNTVCCLLDRIRSVGKEQRELASLGDSPRSIVTQQREHRERLAILRECDAIISNDNAEAGARLPADYWRFLVCDLTFDQKQVPEEVAEGYGLYRYAMENYPAYYGGNATVIQTMIEIGNNPLYVTYSLLHNRWTHGRVPFRTGVGYIGWVPRWTETGDWIVLVPGSKVPLVLRPVIDERDLEQKWKLIGEAYVHSIMQIADVMGEDAFRDLDWVDVSII